jgi:hypothetical protein
MSVRLFSLTDVWKGHAVCDQHRSQPPGWLRVEMKKNGDSREDMCLREADSRSQYDDKQA